MSRNLILVAFAAGLVAGAAIMAAAGLRNAAAQASGQPGQWQIVAQQGSYPQAAAWRINTVTGDTQFCTSAGTWRCFRMADPAQSAK